MNTSDERLAKVEVLLSAVLRDRDATNHQLLRLSKRFRKIERSGATSANGETFSKPNLMILISCLVFCLYQASCVTEVYLKYEVTAEAIFYPGDVIIPPMVTLCVTDRFAHLCNDECQLNSSTFFKALHPFSKLARPMYYYEPNVNLKHFRRNKSLVIENCVTTYKINIEACYAFDFAAELGGRNYSYIDVRKSGFSIMMQFKVYADKACNITPCSLFVISRGNLNLKYAWGKPLAPRSQVRLNYQKQTLFLLPPPYTTQCYDYTRVGMRGQDDCTAKCERGKNKNKEMPNNVPVLEHENVKFAFWTQPSNHCLKECSRTPCQLEQFTVMISTKNATSGNGTSFVTLMFPDNGELNVRYKPKVDFWEFMTLFGSIFGLWLGVSGLQLGKLLSGSVHIMIRRFN